MTYKIQNVNIYFFFFYVFFDVSVKVWLNSHKISGNLGYIWSGIVAAVFFKSQNNYRCRYRRLTSAETQRGSCESAKLDDWGDFLFLWFTLDLISDLFNFNFSSLFIHFFVHLRGGKFFLIKLSALFFYFLFNFNFIAHIPNFKFTC